MLVRATIAAVLASTVLGQDPVWKLPPRGAAEYRRQLGAASGVAPDRRAAQALVPGDKVPPGFFAHLLPAPWLCEGELTAERTSIGDPVRDLRDVLRHVAFDLRTGAQVKMRLPRLVPFGDLVLTGKVPPPDAAGLQQFVLAVATAEPEPAPGEGKGELGTYVRPLCKYDASGEVTITRTWDPARSVVSSFRGELTLWFEESKNQWRKLVVKDQWDLVAVHDNQDAEFRAAVAKAIRDGAKWIHKEFGAFGKNYMADAKGRQRSYGSGRIALGLLTMLHADLPRDDPVVVGAFAELRRRELIDSYTLGVALMAMAAKYAPPGEIDLVRSGTLPGPAPRVLSPEDKELAARWLERLRQNLDTRVDAAYRLRFNYVPGPRWDNSVHQYGLLGLDAADLCRLDVPVTLWRAAANHLIEVQCRPGPELQLELVTHRELRAGDAAAKTTRAAVPRIEARGYAYQGPAAPGYGSMTTAGLTGLALAKAGLVRRGLPKADVMPKLELALQGGFAWLAANFHVRSNPGFVGRAHAHWYYYLYGLERACELSGVALVQGRDWYYEGALQLLGRQQRNGAFPSDTPSGYAIDSTSFAVLFLKKATMPAATGR
ncbi:MAG: hypothetical protein FJ265_09480 [Planctomycetes bacterium]|nr:hypothetical protein [Planctomycetota bacterium]